MEIENFEISTDKDLLDVKMIHRFLADESYWAKTRTLERTRTAIQNSLCFGVYFDGRQVGFARVVTDYATFAYIGDVFVLSEFRGKALSKRLMETIFRTPSCKDCAAGCWRPEMLTGCTSNLNSRP